MDETEEHDCRKCSKIDIIEKVNSDIHRNNSKIMLLNDNKAGMQGLDKESINRIIYEASKGSLYFENEQKKEATLKARIEILLMQAREITPEQLETSLKKADLVVDSLEKERDLSRVVVHIDMDAFYASVEILSRPHLRDVPMAVGSNHMLSTSNYAARRFGVRAGMPGFIGKKLCPHLVIVPTNFSEYRRYSSMFGKVLSEYDQNYSKAGLDEAYLDVTDCLEERAKLQGAPGQEVTGELESEVVNEIRQRIFELTNLTCSAGIAPNSMLAKVCSDMDKPNGQFRIGRTREAILEFIKDLPIRKISGIGKVSKQMLKSLEIHTCSQLVEKRALLYQLYSSASFEHFMRVGLGVGYGRVERDSERKSMSVERTFEDTDDMQQLTDVCRSLCRSLVEDLIKENLAAKTITLKIKEITFQVKTRAKTLTSFTQSCDTIFGVALALLGTEAKNSGGRLKLRLMGVRASSLASASEVPRSTQTSLYKLFKRNGNDVINGNLETIESDPHPDPDKAMGATVDSSHGVACPVCGAPLPGDDHDAINKHLDNCLSEKYIEETSADDPASNIFPQPKESESRSSSAQNDPTSGKDGQKAPTGNPRKRKKAPSLRETHSLNKFFQPS